MSGKQGDQPVLFSLFVFREVCCIENPVPDCKLCRKVSVPSFPLGMMPAVHFWSVKYLLESTGMNIQVWMDIHTPDCTYNTFVGNNLRRWTKQNNWEEFNCLVDENLKSMGSWAWQPVNFFRRMMRFVDTPEPLIFMLPAVHPINIQVVSNCKKYKLKPYRHIS